MQHGIMQLCFDAISFIKKKKKKEKKRKERGMRNPKALAMSARQNF